MCGGTIGRVRPDRLHAFLLAGSTLCAAPTEASRQRGRGLGGRADRRRGARPPRRARPRMARPRQRPDGGVRRARRAGRTGRRPPRSLRSPSTTARPRGARSPTRSPAEACRCPNAAGPRSSGRLGLDGRHALARRADRSRAPRRQRASRRTNAAVRGTRRSAAHARAAVRGRRLELRQRVGLRRRPQELPADDGDRADRAPGRRAGASCARRCATSRARGAWSPAG